jgi:hypothetical protein
MIKIMKKNKLKGNFSPGENDFNRFEEYFLDRVNYCSYNIIGILTNKTFSAQREIKIYIIQNKIKYDDALWVR